jgi:fatty-acyl-CoA synthase
VIDYDDTEYPDDAPFPKGARIGSHRLRGFRRRRDPEFTRTMPDDEWDAVSLNYTSAPPAIRRAWSTITAARR